MIRSLLMSWLVFVATTLTLAFPAWAGVIFCNDTGVTVSVAVGWPERISASAEKPNWNSSGWYNIKSRECALTLRGPLKTRYVWFYAEAGGAKWQGGENSANFCSEPTNKFDFSYLIDPAGCHSYSYRRIDTGDALQYTVSLTEGEADPARAAKRCESEIAKGKKTLRKAPGQAMSY